MPRYEELHLKAGEAILPEWYDKLVDILEQITEAGAVSYGGTMKKDIIPDTDLLLKIGEPGRRILAIHAGYGYFSFEVKVGDTVKILPDKIVFPDASEQTKSADNIVADHEAKNTGVHGVGSSYIAKTSRSDQLPSWNDIPDKPSTFPPEPHADTHKDGGSDEVIGVLKRGTTLPTTGQAGQFFLKTDTLEFYYHNGTDWVKIGKLAGLDLDAHASRHESGGADPVENLGRLLIGGTEVIDSSRNLKNIASASIGGDFATGGRLSAYRFDWNPMNIFPYPNTEWINTSGYPIFSYVNLTDRGVKPGDTIVVMINARKNPDNAGTRYPKAYVFVEDWSWVNSWTVNTSTEWLDEPLVRVVTIPSDVTGTLYFTVYAYPADGSGTVDVKDIQIYIGRCGVKRMLKNIGLPHTHIDGNLAVGGKIISGSFPRMTLSAPRRSIGASATVKLYTLLVPAGKKLKLWGFQGYSTRGTSGSLFAQIYNISDDEVLKSWDLVDTYFEYSNPIASWSWTANKYICLRIRETGGLSAEASASWMVSIE